MIPLEAIRGIAAVIVVVYHGFLGFAPQVIHGGDAPGQVLREFTTGLVNGGAAVSMFFVLSGFVLSLPFSRRGGLRRAATSIFKRWPRLAGMTITACLFAWLLMKLSGNTYAIAGRATHASWLVTHGNSPIETSHALTWYRALREGAISVFTLGHVRFDSALWTMRIELFCSIAIFLLAPLMFALRNWALQMILLAGGIIITGTDFPFTYLGDFLCGMALALTFKAGLLPRLNGTGAWLLIGLALFTFGFRGSQNFLVYAPVRAILPSGDSNHYVWDCGAVAVMIAVLGYAPFYRMLSRRWAVRIGVLSFPIYVVHEPILLSLGAASFLHGASLFGRTDGVALAVIVTVLVSLACAVPLAWADQRWCAALSRLARVVFPPADDLPLRQTADGERSAEPRR
ncbi:MULTISPECIES: acyltransferase [Acidiphilium]|uniref:acyltransferase family protein n=1 Tax=Acidiphilium TaxID=522 RepID=UPI0025802544|nr:MULTISPECIES: acyltransferase [Acidiphilium]HQT85991.1 acyltransferase [Acidiphilium rubrum]